MSEYETGRLIYLVLLGGAIAGYFFAAHRHNLGQVLRQVLLWALIFMGMIAAYGLWDDIRRDVIPQQAVFTEDARVEVPRAFDGHFYMKLKVDGVPVRFIVDTGATDIVLSKQDAERVGIDLDKLVYTGVAQTANGIVRSARARVGTLELGGIVDRNVTVWVNDGDMAGSLLGMAYLRRFARISIEGDKLVLER